MSAKTVVDCERVKRPEPEVLDAEGVPIHNGDTVWGKDNDEEYMALYFSGKLMLQGDGDIPPFRCYAPDRLTHKQPDSLERIEEDARKNKFEYWGCKLMQCSECPSKIEGKEPYEYYGHTTCVEAKWCDLLRRQREVLERGR